MGPQIQTGRVFGDAFRLLIGHFATFVGAAYLVYLPLLVIALVGLATGVEPLTLVITGLGNLIAAPLVTAVVIRGVARHLRGEPVSLADSLRVGRGLILPVLGLSILVGVVTAIGTMLCVVPGILVYTGWFVAAPVLVVERLRVFDSLSRSWDLTEGHRLRVFFVVLGLFVLGFGVTAVVTATAIWVDTARYADLLGLLIEPLSTALTGLLAALVYFEIRRVRDDLDPAGLEDLAALFD